MLTPIHAIASISMIPAICIYISAYFKGHLRTTKPLFYAGLIFFIVCLLFCSLAGFTFTIYCYNKDIWIIAANISIQLHSFQLHLLIAILYHRLYLTFKHTSMPLSQITNFIFWPNWGLSSISATFAAINWRSHFLDDIIDPSLLQAITTSLMMLLIIILVSLFVNKLYTVYDNPPDHDPFFKHAIIKLSVLAFISTMCTIFIFIFTTLAAALNMDYWDFIGNMLICIDVCINFICIFLSYRHFGRCYYRVCICCDICCHRIWDSCFYDGDKREMLQLELAAYSAGNTVSSI